MTSTDMPLVSVIVPTKDNLKLLQVCISSIESKSSYKNYEIIIVDNGSRKEETRKYLDGIKHRVLVYDKPFNFAGINNFAAKNAKGDYLIFLNDDTQVISRDWMEKMLENVVKPKVGVVGVLLFYPNDTIQHAGVLIGVGGVATHAFEGLARDDKGYKGLVQTVRECSAVTGACMMVKKELFEDIGGFDESFAYSFNDVDLCLRLREKGYLVIYTPHAQLYHYGTASRPYSENDKEIRRFVERWHDLILGGDPYYDDNLSRVEQFQPRKAQEKMVLTETRLCDMSEQGVLKRIAKYLEVAARVRKRHGTIRLVVEFVRFLKKRS